MGSAYNLEVSKALGEAKKRMTREKYDGENDDDW